MRNKKVHLIVTLTISAVVFFLALSVSEVLGTIMGIVYMGVYIYEMIHALRDDRKTDVSYSKNASVLNLHE
jgi:predicted membrane protein